MAAYPYQCSKCSGTNLKVLILCYATLYQEQGEVLGTEPEGDHEWDHNSIMWCEDCGHSATAQEFCTIVEGNDNETSADV